MADTIWERLEVCVQYLSEPFRASEIVGWFRRHYPDVKEQSLRAHVQGATSNATTESRGPFATRQPLITRIDRGLYRRFDGNPAPVAQGLDLYAGRASPQRAHTVDIVLPEKGLGRGWARSGQPLEVGQDGAKTVRGDLGVTPVSQQCRSCFVFLMG